MAQQPARAARSRATGDTLQTRPVTGELQKRSINIHLTMYVVPAAQTLAAAAHVPLKVVMARRTKEEALETRNALIDAAELVFELRGVAGTALQEVAETAGVTRGAVYWHFRDKADLFNAMMDRAILPFEQQWLVASAADAADPLARLRELLCDILRQTATEPRLQRVHGIERIAILCLHLCISSHIPNARATSIMQVKPTPAATAKASQLLSIAVKRVLMGRETPSAHSHRASELPR